jgi:XTP/dITP diphosphohydrolase
VRPTLLVATRNEGKIEELAELLADVDVNWIGLAQLEELGTAIQTVAETGDSFRENAVLKAVGYARQSGLLTLADDSGLEVDALGGAPGVHTARFGGDGLTSEQRYRLLLSHMEGVPAAQRAARFRCVVTLASPEGLLESAEGSVSGSIATRPSGSGGFGYDPVFLVDGQGRTMAELPAALKNAISHRARAVMALKPALVRHLSGS